MGGGTATNPYEAGSMGGSPGGGTTSALSGAPTPDGGSSLHGHHHHPAGAINHNRKASTGAIRIAVGSAKPHSQRPLISNRKGSNLNLTVNTGAGPRSPQHAATATGTTPGGRAISPTNGMVVSTRPTQIELATSDTPMGAGNGSNPITPAGAALPNSSGGVGGTSTPPAAGGAAGTASPKANSRSPTHANTTVTSAGGATSSNAGIPTATLSPAGSDATVTNLPSPVLTNNFLASNFERSDGNATATATTALNGNSGSGGKD